MYIIYVYMNGLKRLSLMYIFLMSSGNVVWNFQFSLVSSNVASEDSLQEPPDDGPPASWLHKGFGKQRGEWNLKMSHQNWHNGS